MAGKCAVEAAEVLKAMEKFEDSQMFFQRAADLQKEVGGEDEGVRGG